MVNWVRINVSGEELFMDGFSGCEFKESLELCDKFDLSIEDLNRPCKLYSSGEQKS